MIEFLTGLIVVGVPIAIVYGLGFLTIKIIKESYISTIQIFLWGVLILCSLGAIILVSYLLYLIGVGVWIHLS
jgi:hypothetical protein